jgi:hypothetical protein
MTTEQAQQMKFKGKATEVRYVGFTLRLCIHGATEASAHHTNGIEDAVKLPLRHLTALCRSHVTSATWSTEGIPKVCPQPIAESRRTP